MLKTKITVHGMKGFTKMRIIILFCFLFVAVPLAYSLYTGHMWEDFFITFKYSKNLCEGNGLVYEKGEKVHGFTSPAGTLLPAFCYLVTGSDSFEKAIWLFRILFCIPAFAAAGVFVLFVFLRDNTIHKLTPAVFAGLLFIVEAKSVMFSVNGMETGLMIFFLAWSFYLMSREKIDWLQNGVAWGGMMWTRPDSCIYIAALAAAFFIFGFERRKPFVVSILKSSAITAVIYLPWFLWAWHYYGSPVPHTVMAKEGLIGPAGISGMLQHLFSRLPYTTSWIFAPAYPQFEGWSPLVYVFSSLVGVFAFIYWLIPYSAQDRIGRAASFVFFLISIYFAYMPFPYPWYFPPAAMIGIIVVVRGVFTLSKYMKKEENRVAFPVLCLFGIFILMSVSLVLSSYEMMLQQKYIENGTRRQIGEWLKHNTAKTDRIYVEALGYIGYFSERKMLDFPGLVSPEVVELVKRDKLTYASVIDKLQPEWVVARTEDYYWKLLPGSSYFRENYKVVILFDSIYELDGLGYIPGEGYLSYDSCYYVLKKKDNGLPLQGKAE
ncbi:MAG: hypothetical protein NT118_09435 [Lentisphaerae bacterium]|nr:hypothetical protein [Lentisphaerota bacterium]